jgi:hypothetical protein
MNAEISKIHFSIKFKALVFCETSKISVRFENQILNRALKK